jgi:uncharacterized protein YciI
LNNVYAIQLAPAILTMQACRSAGHGRQKITPEACGKDKWQGQVARVDGMADDFDTLVQQLTAKMLSKKYFIVLWKSHGKAELIKQHLPDHLKFLIALEKEGKVFGSGPLSGEGALPGDGLTILRAASASEARDMASKDPFVIAGARTFEIREWTLMEGRVNLSIDFSDQAITFE